MDEGMDSSSPSYLQRLSLVQDAMRQHDLELLFLPPSADVTYLTGAPPPRPFWSGDGDLFALSSVDGLFVPGSGSRSSATRRASGPTTRATRSSLAVADDRRRLAVLEASQPGRVGTSLRACSRHARHGTGPYRGQRLHAPPPARDRFARRSRAPSSRLRQTWSAPCDEIKEPGEIERLAAAQAATAAAFEAALGNARVQMTAGELIDELADQQLRHGADLLAFPPDLYVVGPAASLTYSRERARSAHATSGAPVRRLRRHERRLRRLLLRLRPHGVLRRAGSIAGRAAWRS